MWLTLAFTSAALLGFYDVAKKKSLTGNAVLPVLLLNTLFSSLVFLPALLSAECGLGWFEGTVLEASPGTLHAHGLVVLKSVIVLTSWIFGYFGMKHLPITIVGPINATRPVMVLVGAMLVFGERLNACQWAGVLLALVSLFMLSRSSRREGVDFAHNVWILCIALAAVMGAVSGLYDKYIMARLDPVFVQSWYNLYQFFMMAVLTAVVWWPKRHASTPFHWSWAIPLISVFLSLADFAYLMALREPDAMISVDGAPRLGRGFVRLRRPALPRTEPACQGRRPHPHPGRHGLLVARVTVARIPSAADDVRCVVFRLSRPQYIPARTAREMEKDARPKAGILFGRGWFRPSDDLA